MDMKLNKILNPNNQHIIDVILKRYNRNHSNLNKIIENLTMALSIHILLIFHIIGKEMGYTDDLNKRIKISEKFYRIDSKTMLGD